MFDKLFEPIKIRDLELRNRVVMSAMGTTSSSNTEDGKFVTDNLVNYHAARAKGGVGLNIVECTSVDAKSAPECYLSVADDKYIPGFKKLTDAVHANGGKVALQLWQGSIGTSSDHTVEVIVPSDTPVAPGVTIPAVTSERLYEIIDNYGAAARRAVEAGFDAVELHAAHNYLPHVMMSGGFNHRDDEWGGTQEKRNRFGLEVIKAIRANIPESMPLTMRISCHDDFLEGGLTIEDVIDFCKQAGELGVDVLNISRGNIITPGCMYEVAPVDLPNGFNVEDAARIRRETGILTMPAGRINKPEIAEQILEDDKADLVIMSRAQIADPEFCNKARAGEVDQIRYCLGCNQGCFDRFFQVLEDKSLKHITCARNPAVLEEATMTIKKTADPKKVLIIGGGIGGIEAADALLEAGHKPVIYEAGDHLGGQLLLAGALPRKNDFQYAAKEAIKKIEANGAEIHLNTAADAETIAQEAPAAVFLATGSNPIIINLPGSEDADIVSAHEMLSAGKAPDVKTAAVIGGGLVGMEAAEFMAVNGIETTVIEMKEEILAELGLLRKTATQLALQEEPVTVLTSTTCKAIRDGKIIAEGPDGEVEVAADLIVMAVGSRSKDVSDLEGKCEELGIPFYKVGDAVRAPGFAIDAIRNSYEAVLDFNGQK